MPTTLLNHILAPALLFVVVTAGALGCRALLFRVFHRWAQKTSTEVGDIALKTLSFPSLYWCIALGVYVAIGVSPIPSVYVTSILRILDALLILSVAFVLANLSALLLDYSIKKTGVIIPITGLTQAILKGTIITIGVLILLSTLGISIAPLITALGVGGLAVALALQETLSNLFAGLYILIEKPIRVGDFVKLESGTEGYVTDIGWRTTKIRLLPNNIVIIPNNKVAQSIITNYYLPEKKMAVSIPISVSYDSDPDEIERILVEEATQGAREIPGFLSDPAPFVRFIPGFGDSSLNFTLICHVREFVDQYLVQHELRKRIFKRFKKEGIEIPFPIRTVYLKGKE